jgi:transcriptional regulator with XRE-family HTH domain
MSTIHSRIKEQRIKKGYTLIEVAEKIGVREATYQRYESGVIKNIKPKIIKKLAEIFNVSPGYLLGWVDPEQEKKNDIIANTVFRLQTDKRFLISGKTLKINTIITATSDKTEKCEAYFFKTTNKTTQTSAKPIKPVTVIHLKKLIIRHLIQ